MIWLRFAWGLVLAGILGYTFHRAWRWEHGGSPAYFWGNTHGKETFVFVPPTTLFWFLLVLPFVLMIGQTPETGLRQFAALAAEVLLTICVYDLVLLAVLPLLRGRLSARACAILWLVPVFLFYQVHMLLRVLPVPRWTVYVPARVVPAVLMIWLGGFLAVGGYYLVSHLRFVRRVRSTAAPEADPAVLALWETTRRSLDYLRPVQLLRADVAAPFSMGQTKRTRCTVLPRREYTPEELELIFSHELHHLQRCDVDTKVFLCLCCAACWFNPLMWVAARMGAQDLERSCDEIVCEGLPEAERKRYASLLLASAAPIRGCTTCLSAAASTLRYRLRSVVVSQKKLLGTVVLMAVLLACVMSYGVVAVTDARGSIGELLLPAGTEIETVYVYRDGDSLPESVSWDDGALRTVLENVTVERAAGLRGPEIGDREVTLVLSDGSFVTLRPRTVSLERFGKENRVFFVRSPLDWDAVMDAVGS